ncbi:inorganic pyrophosphatase 2 [Brachypodium distachyon]|uniref:Uncharacterized protein n=1 Tax=Brachypodium distachyon TaxID=15368 RepID=A0A0Q3PXD8_BRADI|nr:inorganic pyrophosphatase 2 [Brachypodium distachyon]KQJ94105.1 hypothetical protein BRADI_3g08530v3 [Brachypodium distachyon]|eukprot:XP_003571132.1 inorganic pyrophosphatase 2 [Brachypodium distachyon]
MAAAMSNGAGAGAGVVVVFDFDKTIIDCDSDNWVVDALGATRRFDELLLRLPWNSAIDTMMGELHAEGKQVSEIRGSLRTAPLPASVVSAVESAHALGCELRILSDANAFFIDTVLAHHGLAGYFSEISSNPARVDAAGRLRISPYHDFPHGCALPTCPPNMCKGKVMEEILQELSAAAAAAGKRRRKRVVYLGDGRGDYCPTLKLGERDYMMPRKGYPVWDLIAGDRRAVRADVREWADAGDLERVLLSIVQECATASEDGGGDQDSVAAVVGVVVPECRSGLPLAASAPEMAMALLPKAVHAPN